MQRLPALALAVASLSALTACGGTSEFKNPQEVSRTLAEAGIQCDDAEVHVKDDQGYVTCDLIGDIPKKDAHTYLYVYEEGTKKFLQKSDDADDCKWVVGPNWFVRTDELNVTKIIDAIGGKRPVEDCAV
jgi:hypothetical protein